MLYLIRHGRTINNDKRKLSSIENLPLTVEGKRQIELLAESLSSRTISKIVSSPLKRATESSEVISKILGLDFDIDQRLVERDYGPYEGMSFNELIALRKSENHLFFDPTQDWKNVQSVESDESIFKRFSNCLKEVENVEGIVVVTHAGVIKSALHNIFNINPSRSNSFKIRNASMTVLNGIQQNSMLLGMYSF